MHSEQLLIRKEEHAWLKMQNRGEISFCLKLSQGISNPEVNILKFSVNCTVGKES